MISIELNDLQVQGLLQILDAAVKDQDFNALDAVFVFTARLEQASSKLVEDKKTDPKASKIVLTINDSEEANELQAFMGILKIGLQKLGLAVTGLVMLIKQQIVKQTAETQATENKVEVKPEEPKGE